MPDSPTSTASSTLIDLSGLPPPDIVEQPSFEARLAAKLSRLITLHPAFDALVESDPAIKLLESDSYDELVLAQAFNDAARGMLLAFATGARLDQLAALFEVERMVVTPAVPETGTPAVMESDTAFRQRIQLAPHAFSVAGPALAYVYHARSAHGDVADATAESPDPGEVVVTVLSVSGDGVPGSEVLDAVRDRLDSAVRPLTDEVTVNPAALIDYTIEAHLYVFAGPDQQLILQTAQESLAAYLAKARRLGRDVVRSAITAALHVGNVARVELIHPASDIVITQAQIGHPTAVAVTVAGTEL